MQQAAELAALLQQHKRQVTVSWACCKSDIL
jgi:hypothetical protein